MQAYSSSHEDRGCTDEGSLKDEKYMSETIDILAEQE